MMFHEIDLFVGYDLRIPRRDRWPSKGELTRGCGIGPDHEDSRQKIKGPIGK